MQLISKRNLESNTAYGILNAYFKCINVNNVTIYDDNDVVNFIGLIYLCHW